VSARVGRLGFAKETDLTPFAEAFLRQHDCEVYREVTMPRGGRADLVGVAGPLVSSVELKLRLGLEVLAQAARNVGVVHFAWVVVPARVPADYDVRRLLVEVAQWKGIGILACHSGSQGWWKVECPARFNRRALFDETRRCLHEEQKTIGVAGSNAGGHFTEFKRTCAAFVEYVAAHPGCSMKEAVDGIRHHYASNAGARAHLARMVERGVLKGVRLERSSERRSPVVIVWPDGRET
jgi:hypothetical protein